MDLIRPRRLKCQILPANLIQKMDPILQVFHTLFDLTVRTKLVTDGRNRVLLTLREHIITDKLTRSICHAKGNRTLFHGHHAPRLHISKYHIINRFQICLF